MACHTDLYLYHGDLAEGVGFEPTVPCGTAVFKTAALSHSATPPRLGDRILAELPLGWLWTSSLRVAYGDPTNPSTTRTNSAGSSKNGRCPLFSNTTHCEPAIALWIFHAVLGATLMS